MHKLWHVVMPAVSVLLVACAGDLPGESEGEGEGEGEVGSVEEALSTVASITLSPSTITGGSGASSTATVTLSAAAPAGGQAVTLTSSNPALAASVPSITVPAGATSATFTIATNASYRRFSKLSFAPVISASSNGSAQSATLTVTAQPIPGPIPNASSQRYGTVCGGSFPSGPGAEYGVLYTCVLGEDLGHVGTCTFKQECAQFGCQTKRANGFQYSDACATSGAFPVSLSPSYVVSGARSVGTLSLGQAAPAGSDALAMSSHSQVTAFPTGYFNIATGATSATFTIATSVLPSTQFAAINAAIEIPVPISGGGTFISKRLGLAWLTLAPPDPPPSAPQPTLGYFPLYTNPVTGGNSAYLELWLSGLTASGVTLALTSSHPEIVSVPPSLLIPAGSNVNSLSIPTRPPAQRTDVTLTATDGRYALTNLVSVQ